MISSETFINITIVFLITVVFGYLLGLTITNVVDQRLSDISINLPKVNLPRQNIYVNLDMDSLEKKGQTKLNSVTVRNQFRQNRPDSGPSFQLKSPDSQIKPFKQIHEGFESGTSDDESDLVKAKQLNMPTAIYEKDFAHPREPTVPVKEDQLESIEAGYISSQETATPSAINQSDDQKMDNRKCASNNAETRPVIGCRTDADCNVVFGNGRNKCLSNNKCYCVEGSGLFCHYGPTYYKDPKDMSDRQLQKFKLKAKFDKMTVQDYVNWLMLFEDDLEALAPRHLNNFIKLKKGIKLTLNDIPRDKIPPPMTAQDYFTQLYTLDDQINIYSPQVSNVAGLQIPANYSDYSEFGPPQNLKHLLVRPLTLDQELTKSNNKGVLQTLQTKISNDWHPATDNQSEQRVNGKKPMEAANKRIVDKLKSQISNTLSYPEN
jgi:hypothetical protein